MAAQALMADQTPIWVPLRLSKKFILERLSMRAQGFLQGQAQSFPKAAVV